MGASLKQFDKSSGSSSTQQYRVEIIVHESHFLIPFALRKE